MLSDLENDPIIRPKQLIKDLDIHQATLHRWIEAQVIPAPLRTERSIIGWRRSTIETWLKNCEVDLYE